MCSPRTGPGRRFGSPGVRDILTGTPSSLHVLGPGLVELDDHLALLDQVGFERLAEVEHRLEAAVVVGGELRPLGAGPLLEDLLDLGVGLRAGRIEGVARSRSGALDPLAERRPELGLERAEGDVAVLAGVGAVTDEAAGEALARRASARCRRRSTAAAAIAIQASEPSVIETSTNWPSPERSRSRSAAMIPNAAISPPPPRSAIWPPDWTGGPSGSPERPSTPFSPR